MSFKARYRVTLPPSALGKVQCSACADIAEFAAGPRSKAEEAEGIVKYPSAGAPSAAGPRSKAEEEKEEVEGIVQYPSAVAPSDASDAEGVVDYPVVGAGAGHGAGSAQQKDLTGPDGLGDPSDWDPPPREIPHAGPRRGGGAAAADSVRPVSVQSSCDLSSVANEFPDIGGFCKSPVALRSALLHRQNSLSIDCSFKPECGSVQHLAPACCRANPTQRARRGQRQASASRYRRR